MNKFRDYINGVPGGWKPSDATVERLRKFRDSLNYHRLRASGCSTTEARRLKRSPDIERDLAILRKTAQVIADQKNIPLAAVLWANRRSDRLVQDWEKYVKAKFSLVLDDEEFDEDAEWDDYLDSESGISETDASNDDMDGDYL